MDEWRLYGDEGKRNGALSLSPPSRRLEQWLSLCVFYQGHERGTISLSAINSTVSFEADYPSVEAMGNKGLGDNRQRRGAEVPSSREEMLSFRFCRNSKKKKKKSLICQRAHLSAATFCTRRPERDGQFKLPRCTAALPSNTSGGLGVQCRKCAFAYACRCFNMQNRRRSRENLCPSNSEPLKGPVRRI